MSKKKGGAKPSKQLSLPVPEYRFRLTMSDGKEVEVPFTVEPGATPWQFCMTYLHLVGLHNVIVATLHDQHMSVMQMYEPEIGWFGGPGSKDPLP